MKFFIPEDLNSVKSGKHKFLKQLKNRMVDTGLVFTPSNPDIVLHLGRNYDKYFKKCKTVCRLDNLEFNTRKPYRKQNKKVKKAISNSSAVVFQNKYASDAHFNFLDLDKNILHACILNGAEVGKELTDVEPRYVIANCIWRPHKRLSENIRYFLEFSNENDCLVIAGDNPDVRVSNPRIFYSGDLSWCDLISLYKRSSFFLHLAFLDHCPNVAVDARASGCHIICSSSGGTKEIVGKNSTVIIEDEWDLSPLRLYSPPRMDFSNTSAGERNESIDIKDICEKYIKVFEDILK